GHGRPEVESVRQRDGRKRVAAREDAVRVRAAPGVYVVDRLFVHRTDRFGFDTDVVDVALENPGAVRIVVGEQDALDRLSRGDAAHVHPFEVPLVRKQNIGLSLRPRMQGHAVLIDCTELMQVRAVVEGQIDCYVRAGIVVVVAIGEGGKNHVRKLRLRTYGNFHVEDLV